MAPIAGFLSTAIKSLIRDLEAGTEEGVRIEVERMKEDERQAATGRGEKERKSVEERREKLTEETQQRKLKEEKQKEKEKVEAQRRKKREAETGFWTTLGLRPLAEPPILDWDWFFRTQIPSELRYKALFPDNPEMRCRSQDVDGERAVLAEYLRCIDNLADAAVTDSNRRDFYENLAEDLSEDLQHVFGEYQGIVYSAADFSRFEFKYLDNDGKMTRLKKWIEKGADIYSWAWDDVTLHKIRERFGHLVPSDFVEDIVATFEFRLLDRDGGTAGIQEEMAAGSDIFLDWPQEVQDKYGYLRRFLPSVSDTDEEEKTPQDEVEGANGDGKKSNGVHAASGNDHGV